MEFIGSIWTQYFCHFAITIYRPERRKSILCYYINTTTSVLLSKLYRLCVFRCYYSVIMNCTVLQRFSLSLYNYGNISFFLAIVIEGVDWSMVLPHICHPLDLRRILCEIVLLVTRYNKRLLRIAYFNSIASLQWLHNELDGASNH